MSFFVYFNTESNKFNFIQGDGQLQISNGQPVVKTNTVDMKYIDPTDKFGKYTISLNSNNKYIVHINFNAINKNICFIDDITFEEALNTYNIEVIDNNNSNVLAKYILCDSVNPIVSFKTSVLVENTDSITIHTNYGGLQVYEKSSNVILETI